MLSHVYGEMAHAQGRSTIFKGLNNGLHSLCQGSSTILGLVVNGPTYHAGGTFTICKLVVARPYINV